MPVLIRLPLRWYFWFSLRGRGFGELLYVEADSVTSVPYVVSMHGTEVTLESLGVTTSSRLPQNRSLVVFRCVMCDPTPINSAGGFNRSPLKRTLRHSQTNRGE